MRYVWRLFAFILILVLAEIGRRLMGLLDHRFFDIFILGIIGLGAAYIIGKFKYK